MKVKKQTHVRQKRPTIFSLLFCILTFLFYSCSDKESTVSEYDPTSPIEVTSIIPAEGTISIPLVIIGKNFGTDKTKIKVFFDKEEAIILTAKNEQLYVLNPKQDGGEHTIKVIVEDKEGTLTNMKFKYIVTAAVTTVAGSGDDDYSDGSAMEAAFHRPYYLAVDDKNNIIVMDNLEQTRLVSLTDNKVTTIWDDGTRDGCFSPDYSFFYGGYGKSTLMCSFERGENWKVKQYLGAGKNEDGLYDDWGYTLVCNEAGDIYVISYSGAIGLKKADSSDFVEIAAADSWPMSFSQSIYLYAAYNPIDKHIYVSDNWYETIYRVDSRLNKIEESDWELFAGQREHTGYQNGSRLNALFNSPSGLDFDSKGNMYIADKGNNVIRKIDTEGMVTTYAGTGDDDYKDGSPEAAKFSGPCDLSIAPDGMIYVADYYNHRIRCISVQ